MRVRVRRDSPRAERKSRSVTENRKNTQNSHTHTHTLSHTLTPTLTPSRKMVSYLDLLDAFDVCVKDGLEARPQNHGHAVKKGIHAVQGTALHLVIVLGHDANEQQDADRVPAVLQKIGELFKIRGKGLGENVGKHLPRRLVALLDQQRVVGARARLDCKHNRPTLLGRQAAHRAVVIVVASAAAVARR
jgi:hypothetical protein